ncbi:MAG: WYL domain-containing protein [Microthrixaceae bacterium]|nr:WYL domain-containing protein [Microthrixaceae bacterium]
MSARRPKLTEGERVEVMLSVLPWLASKGGAPLREVAESFAVDPEVLRADLMKVFYDVEPSVGADSMVEVDIDEDDDDFVTVRLPGSFEEPPRLDHSEALALLAAGGALVAERGSEIALVPALDKLRSILGPRAAQALEVDLGGGDPAVRDLLAQALEAHEVVELHYFSWGSDEVGHRLVDPWALHSVHGHWYLTGWCNDRKAMRHFRLDRVLAASLPGRPVTHDAPSDVPRPLSDLGDVPPESQVQGRHVKLVLPATAVWVVDSHPLASFTDHGDKVEVTLVVTHDTWLDRLLLRLPPGSTATDDDGADLMPRRASAARRILARYRGVGHPEAGM